MNEVLHLVVNTVLFLVTCLFIGRFLLQACRADFYNPISQGIVKATDPVLKPMRMVIPGFKNLDFSAFLAAWVAQVGLFYALSAMADSNMPGVVLVLAGSLLQVLLYCVNAFFFAIIIVIIASFIAPGSYHPALALLRDITEPLLAPARRLIPPLGGLDFSPILVILGLQIIEILLPQLFARVF